MPRIKPLDDETVEEEDIDPFNSDNDDVYYFDKICAKRKWRGKVQYQVQWTGYNEV